MTIREIRKRAKALNIKPGKMSKLELVRAIQATEGSAQCFRTGLAECPQTGCCWLEDCIPEQHARQCRPVGMGARTGKWRR